MMKSNLSNYFAAKGFDTATLVGISSLLMWSFTIGLFKGISEYFGPVGGAALIFSVSALISFLHSGLRVFKRINRSYLFWGGIFFVGYEISLALAVGYSSDRVQAIEVGMINHLWPTFTVALAVLLRYEHADYRIFFGILLSLFGVVWVSSGNDEISLSSLVDNFTKNPAAYLFAFSAALTWPLYTVLTRSASNGKNLVPIFLAITAIALWMTFLVTDQPPIQFHLKGAFMVLMFGVMTTLGYMAWNYGVQKGSLVLMATASYFMPVLSVLSSSVILALLPSLNFWIGACLVSAGAMISWMSTRPRKS